MSALSLVALAVSSLIYIYIAARLVTRGIVRTLKEENYGQA